MGGVELPDNHSVQIGYEYDGVNFRPKIMPLPELKAAKIVYINQKASEALAKITSSYPKDEIATWPNQYWDALSYIKNPLDNLVILPKIASESGIPLATLVNSVLTKAAAFNDLSATIIGKRKKLTDQVNAALTNEAVEAIVW
jgi:hypothetical protein